MDNKPYNPGVANGVGSTTQESMDGRFNLLERTLEQFQENARHIGIIASDFTSKSQDLLNQKIHTMVYGLQELDKIRENFSEVIIPLELFEHLDKGKNPQNYTRELLERTKQKNKEVNGKIVTYEKFRACLLSELSLEMPDVVEDYLRTRNILDLIPPKSQEGTSLNSNEDKTS